MTHLSFLSVYLSGFSLILLLMAGSKAQYYEDATSIPDYDSDYNATFDYSFYSNTSNDDLEKFLKDSDAFTDPPDEEETEEEVHVTMATTPGTTERGRVEIKNSASLPVCLDSRRLVWMILVVQQLRQNL
ncbi:uncharacterized protein ACBR49_017404 [Aulostomus maculatus]